MLCDFHSETQRIFKAIFVALILCCTLCIVWGVFDIRLHDVLDNGQRRYRINYSHMNQPLPYIFTYYLYMHVLNSDEGLFSFFRLSIRLYARTNSTKLNILRLRRNYVCLLSDLSGNWIVIPIAVLWHEKLGRDWQLVNEQHKNLIWRVPTSGN
jgi:hypothetical protein